MMQIYETWRWNINDMEQTKILYTWWALIDKFKAQWQQKENWTSGSQTEHKGRTEAKVTQLQKKKIVSNQTTLDNEILWFWKILRKTINAARTTQQVHIVVIF